ncbi:MAG TPA: hypothetical protein VFO85_18840, partial [Vicinamibacteria bacterium]|nr:hypothetical protein [Vicinamibacteria bacterium]
ADGPVENTALRREIARAQRIVEGQDFEIRRTLWRYASAIEDQRRAVHERRQALLLGQAEPLLWKDDPRYDVGWRDHLAFVAELREGIHLVRLGGDDPLARFKVETALAFRRMQQEVEAAVLGALDAVDAGAPGLGLSALALKGPSSTWTYLVNDDPFRDQLGAQLMGPGGPTMAMGAAALATPLFILLGLAERFWKKRRRFNPGRARAVSGPRGEA